MELHGGDVVALNDGAEFLPMLAQAHGPAEARRAIGKTMIEVEVGGESGRKISPCMRDTNSIPAHVGHAYPGSSGKPLHLPANPAQSGHAGRLIAPIREQLHAHANPQERPLASKRPFLERRRKG